MKVHLMYADRDFGLGGTPSPRHEDLLQDLQLDAVLEAMARGDKFLFEVAKRAVLTSLAQPQAITYRQKVFDDCLSEAELVSEMYALAVAALEGERGIYGYFRPHPSGVLRRALTVLELLLTQLRRLRQIGDEHSHRFRSEGMTAFFQTLARELDDDYFGRIEEHLRRLKFRAGILVSAELGRGNKGVNYVLRSPHAPRRGWRDRVRIGSRSANSFEIAPRDDAGARALAELTDRGLDSVANALAQSTDHILSFFKALRTELGFYISCLNLHASLLERGVPTCTPVPLASLPVALSFADLRDPGLCLRLDGTVVGNQAGADGKQLIMVTGANSGGKSTFLRSIGVAQLMLQCGMFVVAESFQSSLCTGLFTHFIREEDPTMSSGRLDEELSRMSAIADQLTPSCMVLFNESFAATNEREGSEIARQIVRALLDGDVRVVFVTHHFDLAHSTHAQQLGHALFLRAERESGGRRTFRLVPGEPLSTSFGQDVLRHLGGLPDAHPAGATGIGKDP